MNPFTKITTHPGPEDIILDPKDGNRIIISCTKRWGLLQLKGKLQYFYLDDKMDVAKDFVLYDFPYNNIQPHGIYAQVVYGVSYLYVVCHYKREKILKFKIDGNTLIHQEVIAYSHSLLKNPNDLYVTKEDEIYVTCTPNFVQAFSFKKRDGYVLKINQRGKFLNLLKVYSCPMAF